MHGISLTRLSATGIMMELTPVRVYLMYTIPVACLTLSFLLLYPEIVVRQRFKPAACKVQASEEGVHDTIYFIDTDF